MTQKVYKLINADVSTGGASGKVKITAADTSADFVNSKITTDSTITKTTVNPGGIEQLRLEVNASAIAHQDLSGAGANTHSQIDDHIANTSNPHSVTKSQVGLGDVDNTSDLDKPISNATQSALDTLDEKTDKFVVTFNATTDWTLNVDQYELTSLAATHLKGSTPLFYVVDDLGDTVELASNVDVNGNITISVASDLRFAGKLIIL